jgi:hypothetical protein
MEYAAIKPTECDRYREHKEQRREEDTARLQREWAACTDELRTFVDLHNLRNVDPSGAGCRPPLQHIMAITHGLLTVPFCVCSSTYCLCCHVPHTPVDSCVGYMATYTCCAAPPGDLI